MNEELRECPLCDGDGVLKQKEIDEFKTRPKQEGLVGRAEDERVKELEEALKNIAYERWVLSLKVKEWRKVS